MLRRLNDSIADIEADSRVLRGKPFLLRLYADFYDELRRGIPEDGQGVVVELGAGAGFLKKSLPQLIASDILATRFIDACFDARHLPFSPNSLKGIVMLNVFHHLPSVGLFLSEAERCLATGGAVVMIEPWISVWSYWIFKLFHHEATDPFQKEWGFESSGPLSGANQALPWIVFRRDRVLFERQFPKLRIEAVRPHTPLRYLASGGLSHRAAAPERWYETLSRMESRTQRLGGLFCMFATIILRRIA